MGTCGAEEEKAPKAGANGEEKKDETGGGAQAENAVAESSPLEDGTVTLAPYFKLKNAEKFKELWKADYEKFAHKDDCVHYAFTFTDDGRAHCREAYKNAEGVIQHIEDVGGVFHPNDAESGCIHPDNADLEKLEIHGPAQELEKIKQSKFANLPFQYFVTEWGFRPAKPAMENDTVVHLYPYFKLKNEEHFKKIWSDAYPTTQGNAEAEKTHQYAFSFCENYMDDGGKFASCRESYADAESMLLHIKHVGGQFHNEDAATGCIHPDNADLDRLEIHGPAEQLEVVKNTEGIKDLPWTYFTTEWGFRNETK